MSVIRRSEKVFDHLLIESKWQNIWSENQIYNVREDSKLPKWYELTMYPYPSGDLHVGHWYAMSPADAHARFKRMNGFNVLHPMGFDAFGLPAENAAISRGIHPYKWTMDNISNMRRQLKSMGSMYDWDREIVTCEPSYYQWNQWFFLQLFKKGLAYRDFAPANWCPGCNTVLANEQVLTDGTCERCDSLVERRELNQWFFKITNYAEELLNHSEIDWPNKINVMQTNWIGKSTGTEINFDISEYNLETTELTAFTTRIDTVFGVTFVVLAPEHPIVQKITTPENLEEVNEYINKARHQSEIERLSTEKVKTGVFTGSFCINPMNGEKVPLLVGDYVLMTYGTGVVMGVPAHDQRDFEFAQKYQLPIRVVVAPKEWKGENLDKAYTDPGMQVNSMQFDGMNNQEGIEKISDYIEENSLGQRTVNYRMRDWLISRQRYWGTPIPIIYCEECGTLPVPETDLPVVLPEDAEFRPTGESPLKFHADFLNVNCPECGKPSQRETDTMDTFVDSSWYFLRFTNPDLSDGPFDPQNQSGWGMVDQYTGGAEHAVMHLLYSRFFVKALRDMGIVKANEPFNRLFNQGIILGQDHEKMSKSRGNVVSPDDYVKEFGADAVRCFLMFLGPWDQGGSWSDEGINGMSRWLNRLWDICNRDSALLNESDSQPNDQKQIQRITHKTIRRVTEDLVKFKFNTALAALMELTNELNKYWESKTISSDDWNFCTKSLILMLAPMAPHVSEELWQKHNHEFSVHTQSWPTWDDEIAADEIFTMVVQINGKVRDKIVVPVSIEEDEAHKTALSSPKISAHLENSTLRRIIYIPGKLVNIVAN